MFAAYTIWYRSPGVPVSLAVRHRQPELMDDPALPADEHRQALAGLARVNRFTRSARLFWPTIAKQAAALGRPVHILDIATGSGDIPHALHRIATARGVPLDISACDISPVAIAAAEQGGPGVRFFVHDVVRHDWPGKYDVATCSLFLHHLDEADAVRVLERMRRSARIVLVNDLARSRANFALVWLACRMFSRSPIVHIDGPLSVRGAFTAAELLRIAAAAGLDSATVTPKFPARMLLHWADA
jgi:2-polyprenyl-3-methyl-5-hydroxy-6-metoxy-1,4-benzoquinol methylase